MKIVANYTNAAKTAVMVDVTNDDGTIQHISGDLPLAGQYVALLDGVTIGAYKVPPADLVAYAVRAQAATLSAGQTFNVAAQGQSAVNVLCDGTNSTRADLALLALFGQDNPAGTKTWIDNKGVATVLTGAQLVTLATAAGNWIADTYPVLSAMMNGAAAGDVTTTSQIDAAFAAVTA